LMSLTREYESLATTDGLIFFGTSESRLYAINPVLQTETLVGDTDLDRVFGLEFADTTLMGFGFDADRLVPMDIATGASLGSPFDMGADDLGTILFMDTLYDPANIADAYD